MKYVIVAIALFSVGISILSAQAKWPQHVEQVLSCNPVGTDTVASLYRHMIDAYMDKVSVTQGDSIGLYVSIKDSALLSGTVDTIKVYRYGVNGWSLKSTVGTHTLVYYPLHLGADGQPTDYKYGAQWSKTKNIVINSAWQSGFYCAQLTAKKSGITYNGAVTFVVKPSNPGSSSAILWVVPMNTYQAYNIWGGSGLYWTSLPGAVHHTDTVSFDRPFGEGYDSPGFVGYHLNDSLGQFNEREWAWVQWMESHNYPVEYCADYDIDQTPNGLLPNYKMVFVAGHCEYWTANMRDNIEAFKNNPVRNSYAGGNVAFFSANTCYWFATYPTGSGGRKMVVDKCSFDANGKPAGQWRSTVHGSNHEAKFIGGEFRTGQKDQLPQSVTKPQHWIFKSSGITTVGQQFGFGDEDISPMAAGESDDTLNGFSPSNVQVLARVNVRNADDSTKALYSAMTYYIDTAGNGRVFNGASLGWQGALYGTDAPVVDTIVSNILNHFSWRKYIDTIRSNITFDQNIEVFGNTYLLSGKTLTLSASATITVDSGDTLFVDGTLTAQNGITITGPGVIHIRHGGNITLASSSTVTLSGNLKIINDDANMTVASGTVLKVGSGVSFVSGEDAHVTVNGRLTAIGTAAVPILFTSSNHSAGAWQGLSFSGGGPDTLKYCRVEYATTGISFTNIAGNLCKYDTVQNCSNNGIQVSNTGTGSQSLALQNSLVSNCSYVGLSVNHAKVNVYSSRVQSNGSPSASPGVLVTNGGYVSFDSSRVNNNAGYGIEASGSGSRASLSINEYAVGENTLSNNGYELRVHNAATAFLGYHTSETGCFCGEALPGKGPGSPIEISSTCPPGCSIQTTFTIYGGYNNVFNDLESSGRLIWNSTDTVVNAEYTYWGEDTTSRFIGPVNSSNPLFDEDSAHTPAKTVHLGNPTLHVIDGNGEVGEERTKKLAWLRSMKERVLNEDTLAFEGLWALNQYAALPDEGFTDALPLPYDAFLTVVEAIARRKDIRQLALTLHLQHELNIGNYSTVKSMAATVLDRPKLDPDLWLFANSRMIFAAVAEGHLDEAIGIYNSIESKARKIDPVSTTTLKSYLEQAPAGNGSSKTRQVGAPTGPEEIQSNTKPTEYALDQNYPNPFNPVTTISYQIPEDGKVILTVYDVVGREVATLVNSNQTAGRYSVQLNAGKLASGVYFYRLTAGNFIASKKLLLAK